MTSARTAIRRHKGMASLMAMIFLVLFATMAIGVFASTTMQLQVAENDAKAAGALTAAESGMQFLAQRMGAIAATKVAGTQEAFDELFAALSANLSGTTNMGGKNPSTATEGGVRTIYIPGVAGGTQGWISLGPTVGSARLVIRQAGEGMTVTAYGRGPGNDPLTRAIRYEFKSSRTAWTMPSSGLLTRGPVTISNGAQISGGDVIIATAKNQAPLHMSGGAKIDQNVYYTSNSHAPVINNGAKVGGSIFANVDPPSFPEVDTSMFAAYVPGPNEPQGPKVITASSTLPSNAVLTNIRIKANSNISFGNAMTLNGVIYIESPNRISFGGGSRIHGVIVTDNNLSTPLSGNQITIDNGVRIDPVTTLDPSDFPATEKINEIRQLGGAMVLAPNYKLVLAGGARSYEGAIVASEIDISNGYRGTITGAMINLSDTVFTMMGGGRVTFAGGGETITGLYGSGGYKIDRSTYSEPMN